MVVRQVFMGKKRAFEGYKHETNCPETRTIRFYHHCDQRSKRMLNHN